MADIQIEHLTNINCNGAFDVLSAAMLKNLQKEFADGRVTATEYSKVYIATMDTVMSQSIQFLLQKDISSAQAELLAAQRNLTITQEQAVQKDMELTDAQIEKINKEIELLDKQSALLTAQILLTNTQVAKLLKENEVLEVQKSKLNQEISMLVAQTNHTVKQIEILTAQILNVPKEGLLIDSQISKSDSEKQFLDQRIKTETAQISDSVSGVAVAGVIGKQKLLYVAQTDGFKRDAEQKLASLMINTWITRRTTDDATAANTTNKLDDASVGAIVTKAAQGVDISL